MGKTKDTTCFNSNLEKSINNFLTMDIGKLNSWLKSDPGDKKIKAIVLYLKGQSRKFICDKLHISIKEFNTWIDNFCEYNKLCPRTKQPMSIQTGKSDWVSKILTNAINKHKFAN